MESGFDSLWNDVQEVNRFGLKRIDADSQANKDPRQPQRRPEISQYRVDFLVPGRRTAETRALR